jgi:hypothetical protein
VIGPQQATVIDYLDRHAGALTALLTAVLIIVTVYYALQNRRMGQRDGEGAQFRS